MKLLKKYWQIIFPIIVMVVIWNFSAQNSTDSDGVSLFFATKLNITNGVIRKIAHFTIYAILGLSLTNFFRSLKPKKYPNPKAALLPLAITIAYSMLDEYHQSFVPGRDGNFKDILIDNSGAIAGIAIFIAIFCLFKIISRKNKRKF